VLQQTATYWNIEQHNATHCNTLQHAAKHCNTLQHTTTLCNPLQHAATHCNTLLHSAIHLQMSQTTQCRPQQAALLRFEEQLLLGGGADQCAETHRDTPQPGKKITS